MPDREMDARIAELLGWKHIKNNAGNVFFVSPGDLATPYFEALQYEVVESGDEGNAPLFTADLNLALATYEEFREQTGWRLDMIVHNFDGNGYRAGLRKQMTWLTCEAATPAEALCRVILEAATHA